MKNNYIIIVLVVVIAIIGGVLIILLSKGKNNKASISSITPTLSQPVDIKQELPYILTTKLTKTGFVPPSIKIKIGEGVTFTNESGEPGSVNSDDHPTHKKYKFLNVGQVENGSSIQVFFNEKGTFTYHNHLKPSQTGTVIVE